MTPRVLVAGSANMDLVLRTERLPQAGETVLAHDCEKLPGGKGLNQAVAAARAGASTSFIGCVGQDEFGTTLRDFMSAEKIDLAQCKTLAGVDTGMATIGVDAEGRNQIMVLGGANQRVGKEQIDAASVIIGKGDVVLSQFEIPLDVIAHLFKAARAKGAITMLNPSPFQKNIAHILADTDVLIVNETELGQLTGQSLFDPPRVEDVAVAVKPLRRADQTIAVTLGKAGVWAEGPQGEVTVLGITVRAVDTTGAGDCFAGYLAAGLAAGQDLEEALTRANKAAALSVTRKGAAPSIPYAADVR